MNFGNVLSIVAVLTAAAVVDAQLIDFGQTCPTINVKTNFDRGQFSGKWYEIQKYVVLTELFGKCVTETYDTEFFNLLYKSDRAKSDIITQIPSTETARLFYMNSDSTKGDFLSWRIAIINLQPYPIPMRYQILDTDYTSYYVGWSCTEFLGLRLRFMFVFTRSKNPDQATMDKAHNAIKAQNLNLDNLTYTDRNLCPIWY